ncbi:hypothetical protein AXK11_05400 [Cephaloticoccus primus]|uniref:CAAX prenyl protease 2/Lysostaphin resistance protein A-like domain-containing protein n=1 Tax=Cephaloticoccus primus TaxID=1548207 RepID=A0A139SMR5_9BACT|nr:CPBP family intramembrane glutamic endopeptidase [Cephaloticoccus primus]KXU35782.1 hypothetical protein AXK11_05400 [Cephaloticoccus primus]
MRPEIVTTIASALGLAGLALLWRYGLSAKARSEAAAARKRADTVLHWDISASGFFLFLFCVIVGGVLGQALALLCLRLGGISPTGISTGGEAAHASDMAMLFLGGAFQGGMLGGVCFFRRLLHKREKPAAAAVAAGVSPAGVLRKGIGCELIALPVVGATALLWQGLLHLLHIDYQAQDLVDLFAEADSPLLLGSMTFLAVVLAPLTEELIFRAGLFRYLRTRAPRWVALALPALLFAALHANLASFAPLAVLGLIFALAYERSGTLAVPILAHALFNLNTILMILGGVGM